MINWSDIVSYSLGGALLLCFKPKMQKIYAAEGFVVVGLSWILLSLFGALPFVLSGDIPHYIDAVFETVSGFSTTGASNLPDIEALSRGAIFWRSLTHFLGGMGVTQVAFHAAVPEQGQNLQIGESAAVGGVCAAADHLSVADDDPCAVIVIKAETEEIVGQA